MIWCSFNSMTSICFCLCQCNALSLLYIICRLIKKYIFCICILLGRKLILNWKDRQINSSFFISNCKLHILFTLILLIIAVKKAQIFCQFLSRGWQLSHFFFNFGNLGTHPVEIFNPKEIYCAWWWFWKICRFEATLKSDIFGGIRFAYLFLSSSRCCLCIVS